MKEATAYRERRERNQIYFGTGVRLARERPCRRRSPFFSPKLFLLAPSPPSCQRPPCPSSGTATIPNGGSAQLWCFSGRWKLIQIRRRRLLFGRWRLTQIHCRRLQLLGRGVSFSRRGGLQSSVAAQKPGVLWVKVTSSICVKFGEVAVKVGVWVTADEISLDDEALRRW